jgi:hypothetical protein
MGVVAGCHHGPVTHEDSGSNDTGSGCDGVAYADVCFTVIPLLAGGGGDVGRAVFHTFGSDPQPTIVGAVDGELYLARHVDDGLETTTIPIDVFASSTVSIGDFAGDGVVRVVLRGHDSDSVHAVDDAGQLGEPVSIPLDVINEWSPAAAMDLDDGTSLLISRAGAYGMMQPWRLEGEGWVPQGTQISAPDHLAWSFDPNGDGLRDVGLSSSPAPLHPEDPLPGVRLDVLVSDGLGGFDQVQHEFEVPCGLLRFFPAELTGDGIVDLACYYDAAEWGEAEPDAPTFVVYVATGLGDGVFGDPEPVFESRDPENWRGLLGFANVDGSGLPELFIEDKGQLDRALVIPPPWSEDVVEFGFSIRVLAASDLNEDGLDDLVVHNQDGAYALLSN